MNRQMSSLLPASRESGFSLLEVMIAILIFSLAALGVIGVQASMIKYSTDARYRTVASNLAQQRLGQMWADPGNLVNYVNVTDVSNVLPAGTLTVVQPVPNPPAVPQGTFGVTVTWQQPGEVQHNFTTTANIAGG